MTIALDHFAPAKYFPVSDKPFSMSPGLNHFGTDFGNGDADLRFFQKDKEAAKYRLVKEAVSPDRHWANVDNEQHQELHRRALKWIIEKQQLNCGIEASEAHLKAVDTLANLSEVYTELALNVQEDMALIADNPASLIMGNICMPSFWDPKRIKGANFWEIHQPVPTFPKDKAIGDRLVSLISGKGPYVRFVWTIANDDRLDHHPDHGRTPWEDNQPLWFRTERQITIPFDGFGALFLIRTYLYSIESLTQQQCQTLSQAIATMPEELAKYKGLWNGRHIILNVLERMQIKNMLD